MVGKRKRFKLHSYVSRQHEAKLRAVAGPGGMSRVIEAALDLYFAQTENDTGSSTGSAQQRQIVHAGV